MIETINYMLEDYAKEYGLRVQIRWDESEKFEALFLGLGFYLWVNSDWDSPRISEFTYESVLANDYFGQLPLEKMKSELQEVLWKSQDFMKSESEEE